MRIKLEETLHLMVGGVERQSLSQYELYCSNNQTRLNTVSRVVCNFVIYFRLQTSRSRVSNFSFYKKATSLLWDGLRVARVKIRIGGYLSS
jgi:hypothetical protein